MRSAPAQQSLAGRLLLFAFGSTLIGAVMIGWVAIDSTRRSLQEMLAQSHPPALTRASHETVDWLSGGRRAAERAAGRLGKRRSPQTLQRLVAESPQLHTLAWIPPNAARPSTSGELPPSLTGGGLAEITDRETAGVAPVVLPDGVTSVGVWLPGPQGGLLAILDPRALRTSLDALLPNRASAFWVVDRSGQPLLQIAGTQLAQDALDLATLRASPGRLQTYATSGTTFIGASQALEIEDWHLVLQTPYEVAHAPMLALGKRVLGVAAGVILVMSLLAYRLSARALVPIERLSRAARRIADGEQSVVLPRTRSRDEVGVLTETLADMLDQIGRHRAQMEAANRDLVDRNTRLEAANEVLGQLSITDGLTQLHNHRFFQDHLTREIKRVTRTGESLAMLIIDIDDFKKLNDRFGHAAGDEILRRIARLLDDNVRQSDLLVRYGGEEFVILASDTELEGASNLGEKVRTAIAENSFIVDDSLRPVRVTVSIGVAQYGGNRKRFFAEADEALYRAKAEGKNCVVVAD